MAETHIETPVENDGSRSLEGTWVDLAVMENLTSQLSAILDCISKLVKAPGCAIYLYNEERNELNEVVSKGVTGMEGSNVQVGSDILAINTLPNKLLVINRQEKNRFQSQEQRELKVVEDREIPLIRHDKFLGLLMIYRTVGTDISKTRKYSKAKVEMLACLAESAAVLIENAQNYEKLQRHSDHLATLDEIIPTYGGAGADSRGMLETVLQNSLRALNFRTGAIWLSRSSRGVQRLASINLSHEAITLIANIPFTKRSSKLQPLVVDDWRKIKSKYAEKIIAMRISATMVVPLVSGENRIGGMAVVSSKEHNWTVDEIKLAKAIGFQVGAAADRVRIYEETTVRLDELEAVNKVSKSLRLAQSLDEMLPLLMDETLKILEVEAGGIWLHNEENGKLHQVIGRGWCKQIAGLEIRSGEGIPGTVFMTGDIYFSSDVARDPLTPTAMQHLVPEGSNAICLPIHSENLPIGVLIVSTNLPREFTIENAHLLVTLTEIAGNAIQRTRLNERLVKHAAELEVRVSERTAELQAALLKSQAADRLKSEFIINVNHELRTPLTNLVLYYQMLRSQPNIKSEERLDVIGHELQRLRNLIEELLNLTKFDLGKVQPRFVPCDLNSLIQTLVNDRRSLAMERGLELTSELQSDLDLVWMDEPTLSQAISNLLTNAMNYTPRGGKVLATTISQLVDGEPWVGFCIRDTGRGIDVEDMPHLFERFYRGKAGHDSGAPGTGLGLAIAKQVAEFHHGRIDVENGEGEQGAVFSMWIPVKQPQKTQ